MATFPVRRARVVWRGLLLGGLSLVAGLVLAAPAQATLAYVTGGFPVSSPKQPKPEWVWAARDDGSGARRLAQGVGPHVSPNGRLVVYGTWTGARTRLSLISANGGSIRTLLKSWQDEGTVAWSPDSGTVAAVTGSELGTKTLVLINVSSGRTEPVASGSEFSGVGFSPDGTQIVYASSPRQGVGTDLYVAGVRVVSVRGRLVTRLTRDHNSFAPVWGPRSIAFSRSRTPRRPNDAPKLEIFLTQSSGHGLHKLTHTRPGYLLSGLVPRAWSDHGDRLLAEFGGQDTSYAMTVDPVTGRTGRVGIPDQGLVGWDLSHDGSTILATTGGPDPDDSNVVTIPYTGGALHVLVRHARMASWNH